MQLQKQRKPARDGCIQPEIGWALRAQQPGASRPVAGRWRGHATPVQEVMDGRYILIQNFLDYPHLLEGMNDD